MFTRLSATDIVKRSKLCIDVDMPSEFALMLIMFDVILSELAPMTISREDRSGAAPPPPYAIAAEFSEMAISFDKIAASFIMPLS